MVLYFNLNHIIRETRSISSIESIFNIWTSVACIINRNIVIWKLRSSYKIYNSNLLKKKKPIYINLLSTVNRIKLKPSINIIIAIIMSIYQSHTYEMFELTKWQIDENTFWLRKKNRNSSNFKLSLRLKKKQPHHQWNIKNFIIISTLSLMMTRKIVHLQSNKIYYFVNLVF